MKVDDIMDENNNTKNNSLNNTIKSLKNGAIKFNKGKLITIISIVVTFLAKIYIPSGCDDTGTMCYNKYYFFETITNYLLVILIGYLILEIVKDFITYNNANKKPTSE